jgi:Subtilisin inhibitor-like
MRKSIAAALGLAFALTATGSATAGQSAGSAAAEVELRVYGPSGTVTITCDPLGGTHPEVKEACDEIDKFGGDIAAIPPQSIGCTDQWDPVLIGVTGRWRGKEILFSDFESNPGCAAISHGHVFTY